MSRQRTGSSRCLTWMIYNGCVYVLHTLIEIKKCGMYHMAAKPIVCQGCNKTQSTKIIYCLRCFLLRLLVKYNRTRLHMSCFEKAPKSSDEFASSEAFHQQFFMQNFP